MTWLALCAAAMASSASSRVSRSSFMVRLSTLRSGVSIANISIIRPIDTVNSVNSTFGKISCTTGPEISTRIYTDTEMRCALLNFLKFTIIIILVMIIAAIGITCIKR